MRSFLRHPRRAAGFTLIEMVAVMIILATMMAIGLPSLSATSPSLELAAQVDELARTLRDARTRAVLNERTIRLELDPATSRIAYFYDEPEPGQDPLTFDPEEPFRTADWNKNVVLDQAIIGQDETFIGETVVLEFWSSGLATPVRLHVHHKKAVEQRRTITMNPLTGQTTIERGHVEPEQWEPKITAPANRRR